MRLCEVTFKDEQTLGKALLPPTFQQVTGHWLSQVPLQRAVHTDWRATSVLKQADVKVAVIQ